MHSSSAFSRTSTSETCQRQLLTPIGILEDAQGWPVLTFPAYSSVLLERRQWDGRREAVRWSQAPCCHGTLHRRATPDPEPRAAGAAPGSSSAGADVMRISQSRAKH